MDVKQTLMDFVGKIDAKLITYWDEQLAHDFGFSETQKSLVRKILLHASEHNLRPAKRLRGSFVYFSSRMSGEGENIAWEAALALELVHTALLMHDDVMDGDDVRRGKPTTHRFFEEGDVHYGESMAYNVGDAVLCLGFELLAKSNVAADRVLLASQKMLRSIAETSYGQAYDVTLEKMRSGWDDDDIIALHKAKTAIYTYENPLFIGAHLAGITDQNIFTILRDYSLDGGVAFQLQDDILGLFGDSEKTGKSSDSDLTHGKCTLLISHCLSEGTSAQIKALKLAWGNRQATSEQIHLAKEAIKDSGSLDYSNKISRDFAAKAAQTASKLRTFGLLEESIAFIEGVAMYMVDREL